MQWEYCQICAWSVPVEGWLCEVCTALLANPAQRCLAETRVIVGQLWQSLGEQALHALYQRAKQARREQDSAAWWAIFVQRNLAVDARHKGR